VLEKRIGFFATGVLIGGDRLTNLLNFYMAKSEDDVADTNPHDELSKVARGLTLSSKAYSDALSDLTRQTASLDAVSRAITKQLDIDRNLFGSTNAILEQINQIGAISPSLQSLVSANSSFTRMVERSSTSDTAFAKIFDDQKRIQDMINGIGLADSLTAAFARIDTTRMLSASLAAQAKLANLDNLSIGRLAGIDNAFSKAITINLGNLTRSYQSLFDAAATRESLAPHLPLITAYPPVEYYREIEVLETITVDEDSDQNGEESLTTAINDTLPSVDGQLAGFDERLCRLLVGARQSLHDDNPDRARHVTTSLRELFTQVLHALAPDEHILQWTTNKEFFDNNRPTRRARLLYICRSINCDPLTRFVEDDVRAALSFVDSLNSGAHVVESQLTTAQLGAIVSRMESLIMFLLQLRKNG